MIKKKLKALIFLILLALINLSFSKVLVNAASKKSVLLGGDTIGLKLNTGVYVVGKYQVATSWNKLSPWKDSNIEEGDKIITYNNLEIHSNKDLLTHLKYEANDEVCLGIERNDKKFTTMIDVVTTKNNEKSLGLYIKDKLIGIGTLTFIDEEKNAYASLGHGIYDDFVSIGKVNGELCSSKINGIKKSERGSAGEKKASLINDQLGTVLKNTPTGVYGKMLLKQTRKKSINIGEQKDVKIGPAKIYTVISGSKVEEFDIEITNVYFQNSKNVKGLKYLVTDSRLLKETGGIVQGMSGSPIVQNDLLIGAVSHVIVDDPKTGYGIHIEWMIDDLNNLTS